MENPAMPPIDGYAGDADIADQRYWLDVAWRALQLELPGLVQRIESGELDPEAVADEVSAAARRVLRNPEGVESEAGAIDDYQESWKRSDSTEDVYFTAAQLRRLAGTPVVDFAWSGSSKYL